MSKKRASGKASPTRGALIPIAAVERRIHVVRNQKVMVDRDLAELYNVRAIALRQQVKRNTNRFPPDFIFRLTRQESEMLVSQNVISTRRSFSRALPYAFTEQGVSMLSSVLKGPRAAQVNVVIMRAFVRMREMLASQKDLLIKLDELEKKYACHDTEIKAIFDVLKKLIQPPAPPTRSIGFLPEPRH